MRNRQELVDNVNVTRARQQAGRRNGVSGNLQEFVQQQKEQHPDSPFPYLETMVVTAQKYPYAMLTIIVSAVGIIVGAGVVLSIAIIGSVFSMSNTMHEIKQQQTTSIEQLAEIKKQQSEDGNVMRAYEAANGKLTEFMVGMMTRDQQRAVNEYRQTNPMPKMPQRQRNN